MEISATVKSSYQQHVVNVQTNGDLKNINIAPKAMGYGSSVNGGELLMLALATCFCNDLYREATKWNITIESAEVECFSTFGGEGEPGANFQYKAIVKANVSDEEIDNLIRHTDKVAEIHNTLRKGLDVTLIR